MMPLLLFLLEGLVLTRTEIGCDSARSEMKGVGEVDTRQEAKAVFG